MNREGAETHLRLLAEAVMRRSLTPAPGSPWAVGPGSLTAMIAVGKALTAVGALDVVTVEEILTDFNLAVSVRQLRDQASQGPGGAAAAARWAVQSQSIRSMPLASAARLARTRPPGSTGSPEPADPNDPVNPADPEPPGDDPDHDADRFVPVGLTVPFRDGAISGDLCLMSFAHTGSDARFIATWRLRTPSLDRQLGLQHHPGLIPFDLFTVTDDRGTRYELDRTPTGDPEWTTQIGLSPTPPEDIRWLDVAAPHGKVVRIDVGPGGSQPPARDEPQVSDVKLSSGEHLLVRLAERLLIPAPDFPSGRRQVTAAPLRAMTGGLGDIIAALVAADVLSPLSPVPGRLAALCASLDIDEHGITAAPASDLPETWLSLLAHYQRRKPDLTPMREGYVALAATLPELDGIRLALLGLQHAEGSSSLYVLARGRMRDHHPGPLDVDLTFPLSIWLRVAGGRWHAARPDRRHRTDGECTIRLQLVPPLTRPTPWIDVLAGGQSAEVRARLPLRWRYSW
jgi:hypothetical protein